MRVVAGRLKGRKLLAPEGDRIRPTSDRSRQALFNMLCHDGPIHAGTAGPSLVGGRFLDVCCGTGANGIEALSRGAASVVFLDSDLSWARRNLAGIDLARLGSNVEWVQGDARTPPRPHQPADIIFLDPPYRQDLVAPMLGGLQTAGWLTPNTLVVVESALDELWNCPAELRPVDNRQHGKSRLTFLRGAN